MWRAGAGITTMRRSRISTIRGQSFRRAGRSESWAWRAAWVAHDNAAILHFMNPITSFGDDGIVSGEEQCLLALLHDICSSSKARSELAVSRLPVGSSARITRWIVG